MDPTTWKRDETPTHFSNPLKHTVTVELFNDENQKVAHEIPSIEIVTYPKWLADVLKKHLIDAIIDDRDMGYTTPEERAELMKEIEVEL